MAGEVRIVNKYIEDCHQKQQTPTLIRVSARFWNALRQSSQFKEKESDEGNPTYFGIPVLHVHARHDSVLCVYFKAQNPIPEGEIK